MTVVHRHGGLLPTTCCLPRAAGDSFIGTILYGLASGKELHAILALASVVAAAKCTVLGARPGLPHRAELDPALLTWGDGVRQWRPAVEAVMAAVQ